MEDDGPTVRRGDRGARWGRYIGKSAGTRGAGKDEAPWQTRRQDRGRRAAAAARCNPRKLTAHEHEATTRFGCRDRGRGADAVALHAPSARPPARPPSCRHEGAMTRLLGFGRCRIFRCVRPRHIFCLVSCPPWWLRQSPGPRLNILTSLRLE